MASIVPAATTPDQSRELIETATRGGVVTIRVQALAPGLFFLLPQDNKRSYLGFSLVIPANSLVVCPGSDNAPHGFTLHANESIIEFGGEALRPVVQGVWWLVASAPADIDVILFRGQ